MSEGRTLKINRLNLVLMLGLAAIMGILVVQLLWTRQAFSMEGKKFSQKVHVTLLQVVDRLYRYSNNEFPLKNPINKVSNDYYIVNVNNDFDAEVLEFYLKSEFERANLLTDFEYAIYKCESDEMVYGNYISFSDRAKQKSSFHFPKQKNLVYYFAIRFPNESGYLLGSMKFWLALSFILIIILLIYVYSIFTILQQKKYSELQKDFINNMTHEFKTPLSSILIASNYLLKQEEIKANEKLETDERHKEEMFYKCYLTNSVRLNDSDITVQLAYMGIKDGVPFLGAAFTIEAHKSEVSDPLMINSAPFSKAYRLLRE